MEKLLVLVLLAAAGVVVAKLRADAARGRKEVLARLAVEREQRGGVDYSPTAELFREVGVVHDPAAPLPRAHVDAPPPPAASARPTDGSLDAATSPVALDDLPAPSGTPAMTTPVTAPAIAATPPQPATPHADAVTSDLRTLFRGIAMPAGLRPLGALEPHQAAFVSSAAPGEVRAALAAEFERLGCATRWVEPATAQTERDGHRGLVTIYPNPAAALDLDGTPLFSGVGAGEVVVRMVAL